MPVRTMIAKLIAFNTVSRDSNLALIDYVRDYLDDHGITSQLVPSDDGRKANLYASVGPAVEGGVVLSGHTDVVPVDGQPWDTDPFVVTERDGQLYGRGTCDMKSFIAIGLALVPEMNKLRKPIHFALSYDEEVGCQGAPRMIREIAARLPRPAAVVVGEPTSMKVVTAHKGITVLKTTVTGYEAHSSQVHRGVSAVMTAARLITYLDDLAQHKYASETTNPDFAPGHTSIHVGTVQGGTAVNIISRHCEFGWDIRNLPGEDPQPIIDRFQDHCRHQVEPAMRARAPHTGVQTEVMARVPAFRHDPDSGAVQLAKAITGQNDTFKVAYAAEAGQFQMAGLPTVICGPGSIDQAHQPNEYISLEQVEAGTRFIRKLIEKLS
ncbi:MAG: acetylornithine deacetylase [Gammaproteobacteria bacterium]